MAVDKYLNLITSEHRDKPKFMATVELTTSFFVQVQDVVRSFLEKFDLDNAAGSQLDIVGKWVGITRNVAIPADGVYFQWDGSQATGWDFGSWGDTRQPVTITSLPDDAYRTLIRTKIAANQWDGTTEGAYEIWDQIFPVIRVLILDNQDMSYDLGLVGAIVDSLTLALVTGGYLKLKPEGVRINQVFVAVDSNPLFAWDSENEYLGGWDEASWARIITL